MADRTPSGKSSTWKFEFDRALRPEADAGVPSNRTPRLDLVEPSTPLGSDDPFGPEAVTGEVVSAVRESSQSAIMKSVHAADAFSGLHPKVQHQIANVCDSADNPFDFDEKLRLFAEDKLFLQQLNDWLLMRSLKVRIVSSEPADEGWAVVGDVASAIKPGMRDMIMVKVTKISGDFSRFSRNAEHVVPLRNIIPFNLTK